MEITLDIFSGMPNPTWELTGNDLTQLVDRLAGRAMPHPDDVESVLGYRSFIISSQDDDEAVSAKLPDSFRVGGLIPQRFVAAPGVTLPMLSSQESDEVARWLLTTARGAVTDEILTYVENEIKQRAITVEAQLPVEVEAVEPEIAGCEIRNGAYNPGFWNKPKVQPYNNCYNYAMNNKTNTFAQPGRISGHPTNIAQCANVATAANFDGCVAACAPGRTYKNVALVIWPGVDFHWYRLHSNGFWGHKAGMGPATNIDNKGRVIKNPSNCDRGKYTNFCGYRFSPRGMRVK